MSHSESLSARWTRLRNRIAARRAALLGAGVTRLVTPPEPRSIGLVARGRRLCAGRLVLGGHLVEAPGAMLWDVAAPDAGFAAEAHGFGWLDDLAAAGDAAARDRAQEWLWEWIARYGRGRGPGWAPELAGRRVIRWINHAAFVLRGQSPEAEAAFFRTLAVQARFLGWRWQAAAPGLARFEALTGLVHAGVSLEGMAHLAGEARAGLGRECAQRIDAGGAIPSRNPEELLEVFTLLTWSALALREAGQSPEEPHWRAVERIAPCLRALRHADGGLARFHGGGRGLEGRLDAALAASGVAARATGLAMGYARLAGGRTSVIVDAAPPPAGEGSEGAHASTLAFELTSGRRPVIVNCGSGASFGAEWRRAGRATPSHSTLVLAGCSSARLSDDRRHPDRLSEAPRDVPAQITRGSERVTFEGGHDGYRQSHGLTHARRLDLAGDGRLLEGEDMLLAIEAADKARFDGALAATRRHGLPFDIRFHLHPEVSATPDETGTAVSLLLRSGEIWIFRVEGGAALALRPGVYLEKTRLKPRAARQIVLSGLAVGYATRVRWSLAKAPQTPVAIRDLAGEAPEPGTED
ncbi:MAG: heparinase II/III family protein [Roseovarius sp.]|nr:heparinase II/III family protein [Roseovarius sp.]